MQIKLEMTKDVLNDSTKIQRIIREFYEQLYVNKIVNVEEMDKLLETYKEPRLNNEEIEKLSRPIRRLFKFKFKIIL